MNAQLWSALITAIVALLGALAAHYRISAGNKTPPKQ